MSPVNPVSQWLPVSRHQLFAASRRTRACHSFGASDDDILVSAIWIPMWFAAAGAWPNNNSPLHTLMRLALPLVHSRIDFTSIIAHIISYVIIPAVHSYVCELWIYHMNIYFDSILSFLPVLQNLEMWISCKCTGLVNFHFHVMHVVRWISQEIDSTSEIEWWCSTPLLFIITGEVVSIWQVKLRVTVVFEWYLPVEQRQFVDEFIWWVIVEKFSFTILNLHFTSHQCLIHVLILFSQAIKAEQKKSHFWSSAWLIQRWN